MIEYSSLKSIASLILNKLLPSRVVSNISRIYFKEISLPWCFAIILKQIGPQSLEFGWLLWGKEFFKTII
jgi:hypothetical protein